MPEPRDAAFTSSRADAEFNARFHEPVKQMLTELITDSGPVYERIGKCWSEVEGVLEAIHRVIQEEGVAHAHVDANLASEERPEARTQLDSPNAGNASQLAQSYYGAPPARVDADIASSRVLS